MCAANELSKLEPSQIQPETGSAGSPGLTRTVCPPITTKASPVQRRVGRSNDVREDRDACERDDAAAELIGPAPIGVADAAGREAERNAADVE